MDDAETLQKADTQHSLETVLNKPDALTEALDASTSEILRNDETTEAQIAAAEASGTITRAEAAELDRKRRGCLVEVVAKMSGAMPERFKPRLQKALSMNPVLEKCYIVGLDPQEDKEELNRLKEMYKYQVIDPLYDTDIKPQQINTSIDKYIVTLNHMGISPEDGKDVSEIVWQLYRTHDNGNNNVDLQNKMAEKLILYVINNADQQIKIEMMKRLLKDTDEQAIAYLPLLSDTDRTDVINNYFKDCSYRLFTQNKTVFPLIELTPSDQRTEALLIIADRITDLKRDGFDANARVALAKQTLAYTDSSNRSAVYEEIIGSSWSPLIDSDDPQKAVTLLLDLTSVPAEQHMLFAKIADSETDYRGVSGFDINTYVSSRDASDYTATNFVLKQMELGYLAEEAVSEFGWKKIHEEITKGVKYKEDIDHIIALSERYHITIAALQPVITPHIEALFRSGTIDRRLHSTITRLGEMTFVQEWNDFEYDLQTTERLGERTWRDEQSLIDLLQNHLDANDLKCALDLGTKIYGADTMISMLKNQDGYYADAVKELLLLKKQFGDRTDDLDFTIPYKSHIHEKNAFVEAIADIKPEPPSIEICLKTEYGEFYWVPYRNLPYIHKEDADIVGVRFIDAGLGYDEQLNAIFAPTKGMFGFLRGQFGQGAKMSMVRLMNAGCDVTINSTCKLLESGEYVEWEGKPEYSDESRTVHFNGKKRRIYTTTDELTSGTTTEVMFDKANAEIARTFVAMLDMRDDKLGMGKFVREYLPQDLQESFRYPIPPRERLDTESKDFIQISIDPRLAGKLFIQGLEVPAKGVNTAFCYDFATKDLFTGADRTWLDVTKVKAEVVKAWARTKDIDSIHGLQTLVLDDEILESCQEVRWIEDIVHAIPYDVRQLHLEAIKQRFHINESTRGLILLTREELVSTNLDIEALTNMDFAVAIIEGNKYQSEKYLSQVLYAEFGFAFRTLNAVSAKQYLKEEKTQRAVDVAIVPEHIYTELEIILKEVKQRVASYLIDAGLNKEAGQLGMMSLSMGCARESGSPSFVTVMSDSFKIMISSDVFDDRKFPEQLSSANRKCIEFLTEMQILSLLGDLSEFPDNRFIGGQSVVNKLLYSTASAEVKHAAEQINISTPDEDRTVREAYSATETRREDDAYIAIQQSVNALCSNFATYEEVLAHIEIINKNLATVSFDTDTSYRLMSPCLGRFMCFDNAVYFVNDRSNKVELVHVPHEKFTTSEGLDIYILHADYSDMTIALIPYDFTNKAGVTLRDPSSSYSFSKYEYSYSLGRCMNDETGKLSTEDFFKSQFLRTSHIGTGCIYFPLGAYEKATVSKRISYMRDNYKLIIENAGGITNEEKNRSKDYIETTLSDEYGEGKAWDEGVRIFGDIVQNHMDEAGKDIEIVYQVLKDGDVLWMTGEELCSEENQHVEIAGVRFSDNGRGYTTRQLTVLSESTKNGAGQRGKFGTGMKMLTASCVRHNFDLTFSSRDWQAKAVRRGKNIIQHGVAATKQMVGFEMEWNDRTETGSKTELMAPPQMNDNQKRVWGEWMNVIDPRQTDMQGNKGLERYIRALRTTEDESITIGNVKILLGEPGQLYEGGILIPGAAEKMGYTLMFGYDIDDDIIATQERDVVDPKKLNRYLKMAYTNAKTEIYSNILKTISKEDNEVYLEYSFIPSLEVRKLRSAFYKLFGDYAVLSSADNSRKILASGYNAARHPLSEKERAMHQSIIMAEEMHMTSTPIIHLDKNSKTQINETLRELVTTSANMILDTFKTPIPITEDERQPIDTMVRLAAAEMSNRLNQLYETPDGLRLLSMLLNAKDRQSTKEEGITDAETVIARLENIGIGAQPLDIQVASNRVAEAFVHDEWGITYNTSNLLRPDRSGGVTAHELTHIGSQTGDYNTTFMGMLMLNVPAIAAHYTS